VDDVHVLARENFAEIAAGEDFAVAAFFGAGDAVLDAFGVGVAERDQPVGV
jgi:hypothetical protein